LKTNKGFTLIELLVVISIIGLLASIVLVNVNSARKKAQSAAFAAQMDQLKIAFELYNTNNGHYPYEDKNIDLDDIVYNVLLNNLDGGVGLKQALVDGKYISSIPNISSILPISIYSSSTEDYGYFTGTKAGAYYTCGGVTFKNYLFYVGNNQVSPDFPALGGWPIYYCFGQ